MPINKNCRCQLRALKMCVNDFWGITADTAKQSAVCCAHLLCFNRLYIATKNYTVNRESNKYPMFGNSFELPDKKKSNVCLLSFY